MHLGHLSDSHSDAKKLLMIDKKNKLYHSHIRELEMKVQTQAGESNSFVGKVNAMFKILQNGDSTEEMQLKSLNNLTVLVRESSNSFIWTHPDRQLLMKYCQMEMSPAIIEAAQRCLSLLFLSSSEKTLEIFKAHTPQYFANMIYSSLPQYGRLAGLYLENILLGLTQIKNYREKRDKYEAETKAKTNCSSMRQYAKFKLDESVEKYVNDCLLTLLHACNSNKLSSTGRDSILEILARFVPSKEGINWSRTLLYTEGGLNKLLEVGAASHRTDDQQNRQNHISLIDTTNKTKMTVAILLAHIYDDLLSDKDRDKFRDVCSDFVLDLLTDEIIESKVEAANLIGLLFQGPYDAGSAVLGKSGILEGLLLLTRSDIASYQRIALDAIVLACTKKEKCLAIIKDAVPILEDIYRCGNDSMKIRALVGMCKLGAAGGRDSSISSLADGSNLELAKSCRRFLRNASAAASALDEEGGSTDPAMVRWASEGLVYLTLDAEVKQALADDEEALRGLLTVTKNTTLECLYPLCAVLANVTNSYDQPEILPEMVELAKYAKQHVPETHEKDSDRYVKQRLQSLMSCDLPATLYSLTQLANGSAGSQTASKELIARIYQSVVTEQQYRGAVIQAGGGKALLSLATSQDNSDSGRTYAAHALAKIAITIDPRTAFTGQRSLEVIRPLVQLLRIDNTGLQNFESLLALTNLASLDDYHRRRIVTEQGLSQIEYYMFEEHEMLRRAATECISNLVVLDEVRERFLAEENDRVKLLVLFCAELDDVALMKAASGALAVLSQDARSVDKVTRVTDWFDTLQNMLACVDCDIQHRAAFLLQNLITNGGREFCEFVANSNMLEVMMAVTKLTEPRLANVVKCAEESLKVLVNHKLIKPI